jgi:hypothetical protein
MEDPDIGPGEDTVAASTGAASSAVVICVNQNLEYRYVGQTTVGFGPGLTEINRLVDVADLGIGGES